MTSLRMFGSIRRAGSKHEFDICAYLCNRFAADKDADNAARF